MINYRLFIISVAAMAGLLGLSAVAYFLPITAPWLFGLVIAILTLLAMKNLTWGVFIALGELFFGSLGHLLVVEVGGMALSLRMAIWVVIMVVWLVKMLHHRQWRGIRHQPWFGWLTAFVVVLIVAVVRGWWFDHSLANIFFDGNGWLYLSYVPVLLTTIGQQQRDAIITVLAAGISATAALTVGLWLLFTFGPADIMAAVYSWIRDLRIGEITYAGGGLWRVFLPSQIYAALGLIIFLYHWVERRQGLWLWVMASVTVYLSLSRSYWLACLAVLGVMGLWWLVSKAVSRRMVVKAVGYFIVVIAAEVALVAALSGWGAAATASRRLTDFSEPAGISRLNQLGPLTGAISQHPLIGSGFGTTVTYQSQDPRILKNNPDGWYTTFTFEWGYLDMALKFGFVGLLVLLGLYWQVGKALWRDTDSRWLVFGFLVIAVTHVFSPYLNHPLGLGWLAIMMAMAYPTADDRAGNHHTSSPVFPPAEQYRSSARRPAGGL